MSEIMTMTEIANSYPNEWLLIADAELDDDLNILKGEVIAHSPDRDEIYQKLLSLKGRSFAIEYIGDAPEDWAVAFTHCLQGQEPMVYSEWTRSCATEP